GAAADHHVILAAVPSGLVIRHAQHARLRVLLDEIDRSVEVKPAGDGDRFRAARGIAADGERAAVLVTERPLEALRHPLAAGARDLVDPQAEIAPDGADLVAPDGVERRRRRIGVLRRDGLYRPA